MSLMNMNYFFILLCWSFFLFWGGKQLDNSFVLPCIFVCLTQLTLVYNASCQFLTVLFIFFADDSLIMHLAKTPNLRWLFLGKFPCSERMDSQSVPHLSPEYFSWDYRLQLIALGFGFYTSVFLLSHLLSLLLSQTYNSLLSKEKVFWNLAATRAAFGIQSSVAGLRALTEDSDLSRDKVRGQEDWSWFHLLTATGFFVFENVALHTSSVVFGSFDIPLATHHFFALAGFAGAVVWDSQGHFLAMVTLLLEMSTPFTCISWMLLKVSGLNHLFLFLFLGHFRSEQVLVPLSS